MSNNNLLASDNFQRANGPIGANWTPITGQIGSQIVSNIAEPNAISTNCSNIYTAISWPTDHASEVTLGPSYADGVNTFTQLFVRHLTAANSGYFATINNSLAILNRMDSGTPTALSSSVAVTIAAGDIWILQAAGACLSLYQNFKRIVWWYDATYTSGSPGFLQFGATIAASQLASWRGYGAIQQDGIWQKRGIVVPALAAELPLGVSEPTIIYEGNPQVLAGSKVYKMWANTNGSGSPGTVYLESLDGISWTRQGGALASLSTYQGHLMKVGSTFYFYGQTSATFGTGAVALYTSTDGINWTLVNASVFSNTGAAAWEGTALWDFQPVAVIGGTWYALFTAFINLTASPGPQIGLATAPDGIAWTRYGSNPVVPKTWVSSAYALVGTTWYFWFSANQGGQGGPSNFWNPNEVVRFSTTDFHTWIGPVHSTHHSQLHEGVNAGPGQCFADCIVNVGSQAYLYTTSNPADGTTPQVYQVGVNVAPTTIQNIVGFPEDGTTQKAADGFTSGLGNLSPSWSAVTGTSPLQIVTGNLVQPGTLATNCAAMYNAFTPTNNQYVEITIHTLGDAQCYAIPCVRMQGNNTNYNANIQGTAGTQGATLNINRTVTGTNKALGVSQTVTYQVGDVIRISAVDGADGFPVISVFQNGFLLMQVQDQNSPPIEGGTGGMLMYAQTTLANAQISSFAMGNAASLPAFPSGGGGDLGPGYDFQYRM